MTDVNNMDTTSINSIVKIDNTPAKKQYKIVLVGPTNAGKSTLAFYIKKGYKPNANEVSNTVGSAYLFLEYPNKIINLWDTAGQERFNSILPLYIRGSEIVLLCLENPTQVIFEKYVHMIRNINDTAAIYLVLTKMDMYSRSMFEHLENYIMYNMDSTPVFYTSVYEGMGISSLMNKVEEHLDKIQTDVDCIIKDDSSGIAKDISLFRCC